MATQSVFSNPRFKSHFKVSPCKIARSTRVYQEQNERDNEFLSKIDISVRYYCFWTWTYSINFRPYEDTPGKKHEVEFSGGNFLNNMNMYFLFLRFFLHYIFYFNVNLEKSWRKLTGLLFFSRENEFICSFSATKFQNTSILNYLYLLAKSLVLCPILWNYRTKYRKRFPKNEGNYFTSQMLIASVSKQKPQMLYAEWHTILRPCTPVINPLNAELNPIRHLLALVGARHLSTLEG